MKSQVLSIALAAFTISVSTPSAIASSDVRCFVGRLNGDAVCHQFSGNNLKSSKRVNRKGQRSIIRRQQPSARPLVLFKPMGAYRGNTNSNR